MTGLISGHLRFWAKVDRRGPRDCWPWRGATIPNGYGVFWWNGQQRMATHATLEIDGRMRPGRAFALHSCDNPSCVNPAHLRWGTPAENSADMVNRGRDCGGPGHWTKVYPERRATGDRQGAYTKPESVLRGEGVGTAKLTSAKVLSIRADGRELARIAATYGVTKSCISAIKLRRSWKHV